MIDLDDFLALSSKILSLLYSSSAQKPNIFGHFCAQQFSAFSL